MTKIVLEHLWAANYAPKGTGPLLRVLDRYGQTTAYRAAHKGLRTTAGVVARTQPGFIHVEASDGVLLTFAEGHQNMPQIQLS